MSERAHAQAQITEGFVSHGALQWPEYSKQDRKDSADTYDYFVSKLHAFSADGRISEPAYKRMTDALVDWGDLKEPVPPASKFFDLSFVEAAWK